MSFFPSFSGFHAAAFGAAFCAALFMCAAPAAACPPPVAVKVNVTFTHKENPVVKHITSQAMTQKMRSSGNAEETSTTLATEANWMVGGLNESSIRMRYEMPIVRLPRGDDNTCFMPTAFNYEIIYENTIYIAEDFKLMGCRYSATMAHEKRHEKTDLRIMEKFAADVRRELEIAVRGLRPVGPIPNDNLQQEYETVAQKLTAGLKPLQEKMLAERHKKNSEVDSHENYMRDTALCPEQFPRFE